MNKNRKLVTICYDHISGVLGEIIFKFLLKEKWIEQSENDCIITEKGWNELEMIGIDISKLRDSNRKIINICTERNLGIFHEHIGSHLGSLLLDHMIESKWLQKKNDKDFELNDKGLQALETLGVDIKKIIY